MRFSRGIFVRALSLVLSFALTLSTIQVAPAYASPSPMPPARRELVDKRTQFSKTYDNRDGTFTYESYLEPIHFANNETGIFDEIDSSLEETVTSEGRGYKNRRNGFAVFLPETVAEQTVSISDDLGSIRLRPKGRLGEAPVHEAYEETSVPTPMTGNSRSYEHAFGGTDLVYESVAQGLKETIVLRSDTGKSTFSFDLDCPGFTPSLEASGSIAFTSIATGEVRFAMVPPFMEDSSKNAAGDHAYSDAVHYELRSLGVNWRLDVVADDAWLSDPERVYPVRIDPTTFWSQSIYNYDSFVTSAYPTTNYGLSTELKVGRYNYGGVNAGLNRTYIKPAIGNFWDNGYTILSAKLRLYCYHLFYPATTPTLKVGRVESDWSETGITYNNQPGITPDISSAPVSDGAWAEWDVTGTTRQFALGEHPNYGFRIYAANETVDNTYWSKFRSYQYAGEPSAPVLKVVFTLEPKVEIVAPSPEVPVSTAATTIHAHWRYDDRLGNKQSKARVQLASSVPNYTLAFDSLDIDTTATVMDIPAPAGGWTQDRYWIRMRVWCEANGLDAASNWTDWQPFDRKSLLSSSDGQGYSPIRASDAVGAGLAVDLPSGRLIGARSDFARTGLGGSLGYTLRYDSAGTADSQGYGRGWTLGAPTVSPSAQILPNAGFESANSSNSSNNPIDWLMNNDLVTAVVTSTTPHGGSKYLMMGQNPANGYFSAYVRNNSGGYSGTPVYPGQRLSLSAWVKTYLLTPNTTQAEYGALMKIHFYDAAGTLLGGSATTPGFRPTSTAVWWRLGLEAVAPAKAAYATVHLEAKNIKGYTYWDDVSLLTHGFQFTDADGTGRTFRQVGDGLYTRDPLEPGIRFTRVNALKGADGISTKLGEVWEGTDGVLGGDKYNYDETNWKADGTSTLTYELDKAELLSEIDLHLWDYAESSGVTPRQYTYRVQTSEGATGPWATAVDTTTGASWMKHTFTPRRVRFVRIVAIGNSLVGNDGFHVCEIEAPVLKLGDGAVAYTTTGAITATADPSGNPVFVTRDASQRLTGVSDNTGRASNTATRGVDLVRNTSGQLEYLNWRGMSSSGVSTYSVGVVDVARVGSDLRFIRSNGTSDTTVLTYTYDGNGRISGTRDAGGDRFQHRVRRLWPGLHGDRSGRFYSHGLCLHLPDQQGHSHNIRRRSCGADTGDHVRSRDRIPDHQRQGARCVRARSSHERRVRRVWAGVEDDRCARPHRADRA
ncbi:MAG: DNRLRE domain-containing protein [Actinomycetia bacterium]|nr:DNRLRE domain-containing protein [Actinomycetes bacterium]